MFCQEVDWGSSTICIYHFICRCLPFFLVENFNGYNVAVDSSIHVLASYKKDRFIESGYSNAPL